jgi:hypothetical protein
VLTKSEYSVQQNKRAKHRSVDQSDLDEGSHPITVGLKGRGGVLTYHFGDGVEREDSADGGNSAVSRRSGTCVCLLRMK